jgi:hypothetical protein
LQFSRPEDQDNRLFPGERIEWWSRVDGSQDAEKATSGAVAFGVSHARLKESLRTAAYP